MEFVDTIKYKEHDLYSIETSIGSELISWKVYRRIFLKRI
jgi:hypothetical protein